MDAYYVRVYTMNDGATVVPNAIYATYEQAVTDLGKFNPSAVGVNDLENVSYVQVEKRFSPTPIWNNECGPNPYN